MNQLEFDHMENITAKADRFMLWMLWLHFPLGAFIIPYSYGTWKMGLISSSILCLIGTISYVFSRGTFGHRVLNGLLLLSFSIIFISLQYGRIEMHFHVFSILPFLIVYRDWRIIPPAAGLIALHHCVFNFCQKLGITSSFPLTAFNHSTGWDIVFLHSLFVVMECSVLIYICRILKEQHATAQVLMQELEMKVQERTMNLKEEKEKAGTFKRAMDAVAYTVIADRNGFIIGYNEKFEKMSGYLMSQMMNILDHTESGREELLTALEKKDPKGFMQDISFITKSNTEVWMDLAAVPFTFDMYGEVSTYFFLGFDASKRKESDKLISEQQQQIVSQSKLSALGEMAASIAHEINNPLTIITSSVTTIQRKLEKGLKDPKDLSPILLDIEDTVKRITTIVKGLRNISRDPSSEDFQTATMKEILDDVLPLCSQRFLIHNIDLKVNISEADSLIPFECLRVQLSQVLLNLLTNAYDIMENLKEKWVVVDINFLGNELILKVTDSGAGIPHEIQEKIFQPFFTTKDIGKGTGLGLSLSSSIIEKHAGKFFLDPKSSHTCFVMMIPRFRKTV